MIVHSMTPPRNAPRARAAVGRQYSAGPEGEPATESLTAHGAAPLPLLDSAWTRNYSFESPGFWVAFISDNQRGPRSMRTETVRRYARITATTVLGVFLTAAWLEPPAWEPPEIVVYKRATCGCCNKWVDHLLQNGIRVSAHDV